MMTTENYKILAKYIKDMSCETPDIETYLFVRENISKYHLNIEITSKAIKNKMIEISTTLKFEDKSNSEKKSFFEIVYCTVINILETIQNKKDLQKIVLCDVQKKIYPDLESSFLNLLHSSGFPDVEFDKKIDFDDLYNKQFN